MTYDVPCIFMICLRNSALGNCLALQRQSSVILESGLHKKEKRNPLMIHLLLHPLIHLLYLSQQALCPEGCQTQQRNIRKYSVIATHRNRSLASKSGPRGHRRMKKHVMTGLLQQKERKKKISVFAEVDVANTRRRTTAEFKTRPSIVLQVRCDRPTTTATAPLRAENGSCS